MNVRTEKLTQGNTDRMREGDRGRRRWSRREREGEAEIYCETDEDE